MKKILMSLRKKLSALVQSSLASAAMFVGANAQAEQTNVESPSPVPSITKTISTMDQYEAFKGKDFDTRMEMIEEICQRDFMQHHAFRDIRSLLTQDTTKGDRVILQAYDQAQQLVYLGRPIDEIDTSQPYAQQLRSCGFDILADIAEGRTTMSKLSDMERSKVLVQLEYSALLGKIPANERADVALHEHVYPEDAKYNVPLSRDSKTINGHNLQDTTLYEAQVAKRVAQKLANEKVVEYSNLVEQR